jgi:predicted anti-sigma-YlaC factor YlaD
MDCAGAREAISAELDGEETGVPAALLDAHLGRCDDCLGWQEQALAATRRLRLSTATPSGDLYERIVLTTRPRSLWLWVRRVRALLLLLCAGAQIALSVPDLAGNVVGEHGMAGEGMADHGMHEVAVFGLALAVAFIVGVVRPRVAPGLLWVAGAAAVGLLVTALADIIGHRTFGTHEAQHLVPIAGALLLAWIAHEQREPRPDPARLRTPLHPLRLGDRADDQHDTAA